MWSSTYFLGMRLRLSLPPHVRVADTAPFTVVPPNPYGVVLADLVQFLLVDKVVLRVLPQRIDRILGKINNKLFEEFCLLCHRELLKKIKIKICLGQNDECLLDACATTGLGGCSWLIGKVQRDNYADAETRVGVLVSFLSDAVIFSRAV